MLRLRSVLRRMHLHLAAIARVDHPGCVDDRDPVPESEPGARRHDARVIVRDLDASPVGTIARSPGPIVSSSQALRSSPASPACARAGSTASSRSLVTRSSIMWLRRTPDRLRRRGSGQIVGCHGARASPGSARPRRCRDARRSALPARRGRKERFPRRRERAGEHPRSGRRTASRRARAARRVLRR